MLETGEYEMEKKINELKYNGVEIPENIDYDDMLMAFITWLRYDSKSTLFKKAKEYKRVIQFNTQTNINTRLVFNNPDDLLDDSLAKLEFIIKHLNKHKALLEASKGIE